MKKFLFVFLLLSFTWKFNSQIAFGNGSDGSTSISTNSIVNSYHKILNISGATFTLINNTAFSLSNGNVVLVINMLSGEYELRQVSWVSGVYINLDLGSIPNSNFATNSQIIKVPQYSSLTVNAGGSITCPSWDGETGGVICFLVSNTLNLNNGQIDAAGKGFYNGLGGAGGVGGNGGLGGFSGTNLSSNGGQSGYGGSGYGGAGWGGDLGFSPSLATAGTSSYFNSLANNLPCGNLVPSCNNSPNPSGRLYMGDGSFGGDGGQGKYGAGGGGSNCNQPGIDGGNGGNGGIGGDGGKGGGIIFIRAGNIVHGNTSINVSGTGGTNGLAGTNGGNGGDGTCGGGGGNGADGGDGGGGGHGGAGGAVKIVKSGGLVLPNLVNVQGGPGSNGGSGGSGGFGGANSTDTSGLCACGIGYSCSFPMLIPYLADANTIVSVDASGNTHFIYINGDSILDLVYFNATFCNGYYMGFLQGQLIVAGTCIATYLSPIASLSDNILASLIDFVVNNTPNLDFSGNSILTTNYHLIDGCVCSNCGPSILAEDGEPGNNGPEGSSGGDGYYDEECASVVTPVFINQTLCQYTSPMPLLNVSNNGVSGTWFPPVISTFTSGTFIYTFTPNAGQCATTATMAVTVYPVVQILINSYSSGQTICLGGTTTSLTVSAIASGPGTSFFYQWYSNANNNTIGGTVIFGATSPTYTPPTTAPGITYYYCIICSISNFCYSSCVTSTTMTVTVNPLPTATAGGVQTICSNETATVSGASSSNGSILWTHNGLGTITNGQGTLSPTYTANASDAGSQVILTMTVTSSFTPACVPAATATYTIIVNPLPSATAGGSQTICSNTSATVNGASAANGTILWTHNGAGTITNGQGTLSPTYTANTSDVGSQVILTMTVTSSFTPACIPAATATYTIIVNSSSTTTTTTASACDSYLWNGTTYTTSGVYTGTTANCITESLNLTITPSSTNTTTASACDSYLWNGTTYTTSGVYEYDGVSMNGCDSIITLNLTISNDFTSNEVVSSCNSYSWNGVTYTESGVYQYDGISVNGCDSVVTLNLIINLPPNPPSVNVSTNLNGEITCSTPFLNNVTYQWLTCPNYIVIPGATSSNYNPMDNGNYAVVISNLCGSDTSQCLEENSILDNYETEEIMLYPNPSSGQIIIEAKGIANENFTIYSAEGRKLQLGTLKNGLSVLDIQSFANGSYIFQIAGKQIRFVIQK